jgi:8-oxo-dGTP diphosphatase
VPTVSAEVEAAGGAVWRRAGDGVEVAVVHRPKYDDWSLPKGKLDAGESFEEAAVREVEEETGVRGELGPSLGEVRYRDHKDRDKLVRWWAMEAAGEGDFRPDDEVDELRWVPLDEAPALLTYDFDRDLIERLRAAGIR